MKRHGNLWQRMISFHNLMRAADKAKRGKRFRPDVARFHYNLERELWKLHEELAAKTYAPGPYHSFVIHEPKRRMISAAPYRERVVHHAIKSRPREWRCVKPPLLAALPWYLGPSN